MNRIVSNIVGALVFLLSFSTALAQAPEVKTLHKFSGSMSETLAIRGSSFGTDATKLVVTFGAQRGAIQSVSNQLLEVNVPPGATYNSISVTNTTNGLTGYSSQQFLLSFEGKHPFNTANLASQVNFVTGVDMYDACLCDLDNDGKVDITTANKGENSISIMRNTSSGVGNINYTEIPFSIGSPTLNSKCGDLNGDGLQDIVLTQTGAPGALRDKIFILQNNGGFTFTLKTITLPKIDPTDPLQTRKTAEVVIADMDLDGRPELLVTDEGTGTVSILVNKSSLATVDFPDLPLVFPIAGISNTDGLAVADMNGDNLPDIVTSKFQTSDSYLFILKNESTPGSVNIGATTTLTIGQSVKRIRVGDLDGDAKADLAVTQLIGFLGGQGLAIFRNTSAGASFSFASPLLIAMEGPTWGLDFGDLDGDHKADITVAYSTLAKLVVLNNESTPGNLSFTKMDVAISYAGRQTYIGDVDGDGKPDVAYTGVDATNPTKLGILRNKSCVSPVISPKETPVTLCDSYLPYKLTATASHGSNYQWYKDGVALAGGSGLDQNTFNVTTTTGSGKYTVKILAEGGTCAEESTGIDITIVSGGTAVNSNPANNGPVCVGSTLNLSIANPIGGAIYKWSGPEGFSATGASQSITDFQLAKAGTYYVDVTVGGCVAKRESTLVQVIDVPTFVISVPGSTVLCQGDPGKTLSVVPSPGTFTYQWLKDGSSVGAGPTYTVSSVAASTGNYTVRASYAGCTTIETAPVKIQVATLPVAGFLSDPSACAGQKVKFTDQSTSDASITAFYNWNFGDTKTSTEKSPEHIFTGAGTFNVTLKVSYANDACPSTFGKSIDVTPAPAVSITNPDNTYIFCEGSTLALEVLGTFDSYLWSTGETTPSIEVVEGGTYTVDVTTATCILTASREVQGLEAPGVIVTATPEQINEGETSQLEATGLDNYTWEPAATLTDATIPNPVATPLQSTTYAVTGTDANGCEGSATILVKVIGEAVVNKLKPGNFFSPNNDGPNEVWEVENILDYPQCGVVIYDDKGVKVFDAKPYQNDWKGDFNGKRLPDGVYFYIIRCDGEESTPRTGSITLIR